MHRSKNVSYYQSTCAGAGIKLVIFAAGSRTDTVESDRALDRSIDALDSNFNNAPLAI